MTIANSQQKIIKMGWTDDSVVRYPTLPKVPGSIPSTYMVLCNHLLSPVPEGPMLPLETGHTFSAKTSMQAGKRPTHT